MAASYLESFENALALSASRTKVRPSVAVSSSCSLLIRRTLERVSSCPCSSVMVIFAALIRKQEDLLAKEAVLHGVEADGVLSLRRLGSGALEGVLSVGLGFLLARHDIDPSVIFVAMKPQEL